MSYILKYHSPLWLCYRICGPQSLCNSLKQPRLSFSLYPRVLSRNSYYSSPCTSQVHSAFPSHHLFQIYFIFLHYRWPNYTHNSHWDVSVPCTMSLIFPYLYLHWQIILAFFMVPPHCCLIIFPFVFPGCLQLSHHVGAETLVINLPNHSLTLCTSTSTLQLHFYPFCVQLHCGFPVGYSHQSQLLGQENAILFIFYYRPPWKFSLPFSTYFQSTDGSLLQKSLTLY